MKIRITAPEGRETTGLFGADGTEIAPGTEFSVKEEPKAWAGRYTVIDADAPHKEMVVARTAADDLLDLTPAQLKKIAADEKVDLSGATAKGDIVALILAARAKG